KSPVFKGGGTIFGPRQRDYSFKLNKKVKALARRSALAAKAQASNVSVLESFTFEAPRTKDYIAFLNAMQLTGKKTLLILPDVDINVVKSSRNIQKTRVTTASQVNTYDLMNADQLLISTEALDKLQTILAN
ncbi:MAG: 50S ribosomal protein L4, partial [Cytophagaceae bacterium]